MPLPHTAPDVGPPGQSPGQPTQSSPASQTPSRSQGAQPVQPFVSKSLHVPLQASAPPVQPKLAQVAPPSAAASQTSLPSTTPLPQVVAGARQLGYWPARWTTWARICDGTRSGWTPQPCA